MWSKKSSEASREAWRRAVRSRRVWTFRQQDVHGIAHKLKRVSLQTNAAWRQPCDNDASWAGRTLPEIRIYQIYRQLQLNMRRKGKRRLPSRAPVRLEAQTVVNGCWSVDFMGDALMHGQRFRTFNVLDDFSREVLAVEVDTNLPAARIIRVLDRIAA